MIKTLFGPIRRKISRTLLLVVLGSVHIARGDSTWVYAVQISANVQVSPPQITLRWEPDQYGANSYTIYRKSKAASAWGNPIATLSGTTGSYTDSNVVAGSTYEYQ